MATVSPFYTWRRAMMCSDLPATTKLVLFVVGEHTNGIDETCWPSLDRIAELASLSVRAVSKHLTLSVELGWLTRWKSRRPDRQWAHAHYRLSIPEGAALQQRDRIDMDLAAGDESTSVPSSAPRSGDAQKVGSLEPRASNSSEEPEPRASNPPPGGETDESVKSYWHHVPTNYPVNRDTSKPSFSHTEVVRTGSGDQRGKFENPGLSFAAWMLDRLLTVDPTFKRPDLDVWACDADAMVSVDGRTHAQMAALVGFALRDKFWARVINSPARLRKNWDELRTRRNAAIESKAKPANAGEPVRPAADTRQCAHVENGCRCTNQATVLIGAGSSQRGYCRAHVGKYSD
ncbi:helix-turn-helix domain-containing protein [Burkholderia glumae]|uniref:Helix-turn-helix domain-containing protein n=1 Tax=Burkholderia glumae TaxID=337 RepID=A0ABY5B6V3_BURGL|nr:helix-turn-helix domain-containing protein [Burkholderia glumae]USS42767.1 helix-turn-helix domain-containing protein [Burkholderia glumae]